MKTLVSQAPPTARRAIRPAQTPIFAGRLRGGWTFEIFDRADALGTLQWETTFAPHWKDYRYYQTLEEIFAVEFPQRYLVLREDDEVGAAFVRAVQPLFIVDQDLTVSLPAWLRAALKPLRRWTSMRLLMAGCVVGESQIGLTGGEQTLPRVAKPLAAALESYARHESISIVLLKDTPLRYRQGLSALTACGNYTRMPSLPAVGLALDFHSYDEYFQTRLGKATRKSLRRKFREVDALAEPIELEVKQSIDEAEASALHALYERVARQGDVHFEVFPKEYFLELGRRMPEFTRYFIWRHAGRIVAFSFCTVQDGVIYDNDFGVDEQAANALHLYHVTFRDIVRWALAEGLEYYYSSPFNYDPKLHLRMHLVPLDLYARHLSPLPNFLLHHFGPWAAPTNQEPLLVKFANADSLK